MKNKKMISIIIIAGIILLIAIIASYASTKTQVESFGVSVIKTVPTSGATAVAREFKEINIIFDKNIPNANKKLVSVAISPNITATALWPSDDKMLLKLDSTLQGNTAYTVQISYNGKLLRSITFTTAEYTTNEIKEQIKEQSAEDFAFAQASREAEKAMPWINKLPIRNNKYIVVYDYDEKKFRIRLRLKTTDTNVLKASYTNEALTELTEKVTASELQKYGYYILYDDQ